MAPVSTAGMVLVPTGLAIGKEDVADMKLPIRATTLAAALATVPIEVPANLFAVKVLRKRLLVGLTLVPLLLRRWGKVQILLNHSPS